MSVVITCAIYIEIKIRHYPFNTFDNYSYIYISENPFLI